MERLRSMRLMPKMEMMDLQNCFCEFAKFEKALAGGRLKRKYRDRPVGGEGQ
jgi:hypothetical protein